MQQNVVITNPNQSIKPLINTNIQPQQQPQLIQPNLQQQQQLQRNQLPQTTNPPQQYGINQVPVITAQNPQVINTGGVNSILPIEENDEAYRRKIDELRTHLPRLEKMLANTAGTS